MRIARVLPLLLSCAVIWALNHRFGALPAIGKIIDPVNGAMVAAEDFNTDWNRNLHLKDLRAPVAIWMDTSLIPHIRAGNEHDLYYAQGYIHATFRLWQMDIQTRAAGGRVSEVAGPKAVDFDRGMRREGMVWGAQHSLTAMEGDPRTKAMLDAYRDGINAYVHTLNYRRLPIEYKLMSFEPEDWTNLRTALLMKYMARDLTGATDDIAYTQLRDQLGQTAFDFLFPEKIRGSRPVIPEGTKFDAPSLKTPPTPGDSVWAHFTPAAGRTTLNFRKMTSPQEIHAIRQNAGAISREANATYERAYGLDNDGVEAGVGSNNWAIAGNHTASGKPILCNDPHLGLNLPSLWYEMQLTAPGIDAYGASLPGAPGIVIGFNEKISWGFTNNYRDVKDFYEIVGLTAFAGGAPRDGGVGSLTTQAARPDAYLFNGKSVPFDRSIEVIKVKGEPDYIDTVLYTIHGPVTYDPTFPAPGLTRNAPPGLSGNAPGGGAFPMLACTWMAHRGSNELLATYLLNRAENYPSFTDAISHFECPAQNIAYADGAGNIAMWGQGRFINKWKDQGKYVMRGTDSSTLWGAPIPMAENPHVLNPPQGYVASANQTVTDSTYPYWYNQSATEWRSWEINYLLMDKIFETDPQLYEQTRSIKIPHTVCRGIGSKRELVSVNNLQGLQNSVWSLLNYNLLSSPLANNLFLIENEKRNDILYPESFKATQLQILWSQLYKDIWQDDFPIIAKWPSSERTVQLLFNDSTSKYYDDQRTPQKETLRDIVRRAFRETSDSLEKLRASAPPQFQNDALQWYNVKNTTLTHLAKIPAFSYDHLRIGGWGNTINAATGNHGPSWRMIVEMDSIPKAYAIYPGGQSGNPGSRHYSDFINQWVEGKYHAIQFFTADILKSPLPYAWTLQP